MIRSTNLRMVESLYGSKSSEYSLAKQLKEIEDVLKLKNGKGVIILHKQCKQELLSVTITSNGEIIEGALKTHFDFDNNIKRQKILDSYLKRSVSDLVINEIYELIIRGYNLGHQIIEEENNYD